MDFARDQLAKILESAAFCRSERLSRFLSFIVEQALDGNPENLKEYSIGVEVYNRGPSFDPTIDPIVRVEARRLRAALEKYYDSEGSNDPLLIDVPKGHYVARFRERWVARRDQSPVRRPESACTIAVLPFENLSPEPEQDCLCDGIAEELINCLTRVRGYQVVGRTTAFALKRLHQDVRKIGQDLHVGTLVEGTVRRAGTKLRITAGIVNVIDGYHLWSERFDHDMKDIFAIQDRIALAVVAGLRDTSLN